MINQIPDTYDGVWLVPGVYEHAIGGRLNCEELTLTLYGPELEERKLATLLYDSLPAISGRSCGLTVTIMYGRFQEYDGNGVVTINTPIVLVDESGAERPPDEFDGLSLAMDFLEEWANQRPISCVPHEMGRFGFTYTYPDIATATVGGATIDLSSGVATRCGPRRLELTHRTAFVTCLTSSISLEKIIDNFVRPLRYLIALAVDPLPDLISLRAWNSHDQNGMPSVPISVLHSKLQRTGRASAIHSNEMTFTAADINFHDFIPQWFNLVEKYESVCDLLFDRHATVLTNQFFNVAAAAEAAHQKLFPEKYERNGSQQKRLDRILASATKEDREWLKVKLEYAHIQGYAVRLRQLAEYVGSAAFIFTQGGGIGGIRRWCAQAAEFRNQIAHSRDLHTIESVRLEYIDRGLDAILRLVLLRELGFSEHECHKIAAKHRGWH